MKLPLVSRCCTDRWHVHVKHVRSTDVLDGCVVCPANKDPARERKGFVVERSRNVNVYASYGKKFQDSYKEKRWTKTCDEGQKRGTETCDERQNAEVKLVMGSKNTETEDQFASWTRPGSNTELWRVTGYFEQANHSTQSDQASSENKARCTIETKESTNRDYGRRANTPNSLNQREIFKFALMGTKPYNFRNPKHDLDLTLMQPVGLFKFTCFYSAHGTERDTSFTRDRSVLLLF